MIRTSSLASSPPAEETRGGAGAVGGPGTDAPESHPAERSASPASPARRLRRDCGIGDDLQRDGSGWMRPIGPAWLRRSLPYCKAGASGRYKAAAAVFVGAAASG